MNPWLILAWVAALSLSAVVAALAVALIVALIQSLRHPRKPSRPLRAVDDRNP